ncbi:MAG: hypothetical protein ACI9FO_000060 [Methylophagaceae bacterium]|jgi:hypothetical protein
MFTRFITASAVSVTLAFSSAAFAASTDFIDKGHYTTDTISGLDWRDVTASLNRSYNDVSGQFGVGGDFEGYRYATGIQFNQMINNFTDTTNPDTVNGGVLHPDSLLTGLMTLLGSDASNSKLDTIEGMIADAPFAGYLWTASLIHHTNTSQVQRTMNYMFSGLAAESPEISSFLVRDTLIATPIPAAAFMFAPALLGFMGLRRRAKNAVA